MPVSLLDKPTVYGTRAKLGVIVPPTNTANEAEWHRLLPTGVTMHAARMPLHSDTSSASGRAALYRDIEHYASQLAQANVDIIAYGCTAGSMVNPVSALADHVKDKTGISSVTTAQAIVRALQALKVTSLSVATPYHEALNNHEQQFLTDNAFTVIDIKGLGYGHNGPAEYRNIARVDADTVVDLVAKVDHANADAILISCTDLATLSVINTLESKLNKPVISSNSATLWLSLRTAGINDSIASAGTLLKDY